jgi:hypothetical protein
MKTSNFKLQLAGSIAGRINSLHGLVVARFQDRRNRIMLILRLLHRVPNCRPHLLHCCANWS